MVRFSILLLVGSLSALNVAQAQLATAALPPQAISLFGEALYPPAPAPPLLERFAEKEAAYLAEPTIDNLIWYGRFMAYKGNYLGAIELYTQGIRKSHRDARLYRHRAHRYITTRQFDKAVRDMRAAMRLIKDKPNEVEPDGMPNAQNIPVSTLHGNIYYHLGLAYYLQNDLQPAARAFAKCLDIATNDDERVSATHWAYMCYRRLGDAAAAEAVLRPIAARMNIIENTAYQKLCLFYKGEVSLEALTAEAEAGGGSTRDAILYGIANWHFYNGRPQEAEPVYRQLLEQENWASFGYIAAEADMAR